MLTPPRVHEFLDRFRDPALASTIAKQTGEPVDDVRARIEIYLNEATLGYSIATRVLRPGARVLEVGSGLGFVSLALRNEGYDVVGLEPVGNGFGFFAAASPAVRSTAADIDLDVLQIGVEELDPRVHGHFEAIFSVHVLEHVADFAAAMRAMATVLAPTGSMAHVCPNYSVPYEPHLGIPLLPFAPSATRFLFRDRVARRFDVWQSLNFVTASQVRRHALANGLDVDFERGVMYDFVQRLRHDAVFAERHQHRAARVMQALDRHDGLALLKRLPPTMATPMLFELRHSAAALSA